MSVRKVRSSSQLVAVLRERERCAKLADKEARAWRAQAKVFRRPQFDGGLDECARGCDMRAFTCRKIAQAIRKGDES